MTYRDPRHGQWVMLTWFTVSSQWVMLTWFMVSGQWHGQWSVSNADLIHSQQSVSNIDWCMVSDMVSGQWVMLTSFMVSGQWHGQWSVSNADLMHGQWVDLSFQHRHSVLVDNGAYVRHDGVTEDVIDEVMITLESRCRNVLHGKPVVGI